MKYLKLYIPLILIFLFAACEESFSPKGDFDQKYIMNFVMRADTTLQIATLAKSYDVEGYNPLDNTNDLGLEGAQIRIWYQDTVYFMKDTLLARRDSSRYNFPVKAYKLENFQPAFNSLIEVEALLPNGRRLTSSTYTAPELTFETDTSGTIIPPQNGEFIRLNWSTGQNNLIYYPRFLIRYYKKSIGNQKIFTKEVPINYVDFSGELVPNFPTPTRSVSQRFEVDAVARAMESISEGDPNKEDYVIVIGWFEVLIYDKNLSGYFLATNKSAQDLSIRLDASDFTNIDGGFGVFGSFSKKGKVVFIEREYIRSFGYGSLF